MWDKYCLLRLQTGNWGICSPCYSEKANREAFRNEVLLVRTLGFHVGKRPNFDVPYHSSDISHYN